MGKHKYSSNRAFGIAFANEELCFHDLLDTDKNDFLYAAVPEINIEIGLDNKLLEVRVICPVCSEEMKETSKEILNLFNGFCEPVIEKSELSPIIAMEENYSKI